MASAYSTASEGFSSRLLRTWRRRYQRSPSLHGDEAQHRRTAGQGAVAGSSFPVPRYILPMSSWNHPRGLSTSHGHAFLLVGGMLLAGEGAMRAVTRALHPRKGQELPRRAQARQDSLSEGSIGQAPGVPVLLPQGHVTSHGVLALLPQQLLQHHRTPNVDVLIMPEGRLPDGAINAPGHQLQYTRAWQGEWGIGVGSRAQRWGWISLSLP